MSFGTPSPKSVPTTTIQQNTLPEWVKREGEALYLNRALPEADRPFPGFPVGERIEPFGGDTSAAFNLARREVGLPTAGTAGSFQPFNDGATTSPIPPGFVPPDFSRDPTTGEIVKDPGAPGSPGGSPSFHNLPGGTTGGTANPEWARINALLQSTNPEITTAGVDNSAQIAPLQEQLGQHLGFATSTFQDPEDDPRAIQITQDLRRQIADLEAANKPGSTSVNPEFTALQSQLAGLSSSIPGQAPPGGGTPGQPGGPPAWAEAFNNAMAGTAAGAVPVGQSDIERYFNPFTQQVIDPVVNQIERGFTRDTKQRHGELARRGSYLNEDRRGSMDILAGEAKDRTIAETVARLRMGAFGDALQQGNVERNRTLGAAAQFGQLAPARQQLGIRDIATLTGIGGMQEAKGQENRTLNFEEFMRQFAYPQNQTGFLTSVLSGIPYETGRTTTGQTLIGQSNPFTQALGLGISAAGLFL